MAERVKFITSNIVGRKIRKAKAGHGSMIDVDFENTGEEPLFFWGLWIQHVVWRIEIEDRVLLTSEFARREDFISAMNLLKGALLKQLTLEGPYNDAQFIFDNGMHLKTYCIYEEGSDYISWDLFSPNGHVLSVGPGSKVEIDDKWI